MTLDKFDAVLATGGIASNVHGRRGLLEVLAAAGARQLIADAGGFYGDTAFYRLGRGRIEDEILTTLYHVMLPAGHGFSHYTRAKIADRCVCTNLSRRGAAVFRPSAPVRVGQTEALILGVIGRHAFAAIPPADRREIAWHPPAESVRALLERAGRRSSQAVLILSYCDPTETAAVAAVCPGGAGAIVSGMPGAESAGEVTVVSVDGADYGQGLRLQAGRWNAESCLFPSAVRGPGHARVRALHAEIQRTAARLTGAR